MLDGVMEDVTDGVCDGVWLFGKDSFEECPLTERYRRGGVGLGSGFEPAKALVRGLGTTKAPTILSI